MRPLCLAMLLGLPAMSVAQPQIFTATRIQTLPTPQPLANSFGGAVIDGDSIIVPTLTDAYLYRRAANGIWNFSGSLVHVTSNPSYRMQAAMKNSIAVIRIGGNTSVWEKVGGQWRQSQTAAPITAPGRFVISSNRFMVGGDGCAADALIYQKNSAGIWDVMGRVPPDSNQCPVDGLSVDFSYDTVVVNDHYSPTRTYHRNGSGMDWARTGDVGTASAGFPALQADTIVLSDLSYYRRNGTAWKLAGQLRPLDYAYGAGDFGSPLYRDGVALVNDGALDFDGNWEPYLYMRNAQGGFDHVGIVRANAYVSSFDISGDTVVTIESEQRDDWYTDVNVYQLPVNRFRARAIANNFEARNVSDFAPSAGSQYSIAGNSYNYLYRQSNGVAETASVIGGSDWSDYQSFEVELKPNAFSRANAWVGIAVRYADADNYYLASFGNDQVVRLQRKLNGVVTTLAQANAPVSAGTWQKTQLIADASGVRVLGLPSGGPGQDAQAWPGCGADFGGTCGFRQSSRQEHRGLRGVP